MNHPEQFIVIYGNPTDGFNHVGPFSCRDDAVNYAESEPYNGNWWITRLDAPAATEEPTK